MKSFVKNAANQEQVQQAEGKVRKTREQELIDIKWILSEPIGRRFLWRYLDICGVFRSSFTQSSETFFLEGQRNIGLKILADINEAHPEAYLLMMKESKGEQNDN